MVHAAAGGWPARGVATLALGLATLAVALGWAARSGPGVPAALFSWDSYSTHAIRMKHRVLFDHGVARAGPAVIQVRRLESPEADSRDYPYPTNDGTPQWPSSAPIHDTRSGNDHPVWDGTQLYRNWGVPRDGVVVSKDCKFLPRKDCLPETMKNWRHGQLLPHKDKQFMIEADSEWKGPAGRKRTPGEQEAKDVFDGEDKASLQSQIGALKTQVGYLTKKLAAPVYAAPAVYAPAAAGAAPGAFAYPPPVGYAGGQLQGWNYGPTPLSAPGLGPIAHQAMVTHTIPDAIMKAFERDDKDWKPVMKKVRCTTCAVAVQTAAPMVGAVPLAQRAVASARVAAAAPAAAPAYTAVAAGAAGGIPGDALTGGSAGYAAYWGGYGAPLSNGGFAGGEAPLPVGPGGVLVPGAGASGAFGFMGASGLRASVLPSAMSSASAAAPAGVPTVHVDKWAPGSPHSRRNPAPKGSKLHGGKGDVGKGGGVTGDGNAAPQSSGDAWPYRPALHALPVQGQTGFQVMDPHLAAQSGARLAADEAGVTRGDWKASLKTQTSMKKDALARMQARAARQGGVVFDVPSDGASPPRGPVPATAVEAPPLTFEGIPVEGAGLAGPAAAPLFDAMGVQMAARAAQQQLSQVPRSAAAAPLAPARRLSPRPQEARANGNMLGRAFIDTLASLVERRIEAEKDRVGQEKRHVTERPAVPSQRVADSKLERRQGKAENTSQQRQRLIAESEMLEQVTARDRMPAMPAQCAVRCSI